MVSLHVALGVAVIVVCAGAAVVGFVAYRRESGAGPLVSNALVLAQTLLIAQAGVGLLLLSDGRRAPDRLHYTYGGARARGRALAVVLRAGRNAVEGSSGSPRPRSSPARSPSARS